MVANAKKRGRPKARIDLDMLARAGMVAATLEEAAFLCGVAEATLKRRLVDDEKTRAVWREALAKMRVSLRRKQVEKAMAGDTAMLIWLGKQLLSQKQNPETSSGIDPYDPAREEEEQDAAEALIDELIKAADNVEPLNRRSKTAR